MNLLDEVSQSYLHQGDLELVQIKVYSQNMGS
jgi:hypothetical protein